ncbi:MAG TPA: cyanophycinase [Phycisphaerales bacterium]|nr:cyanophycinase [Phycisphaerales bacterium]
MGPLARSLTLALAAAAAAITGCAPRQEPMGYAVGHCLAIGGAMKDDNAELFRWMTSRRQSDRVVVVAYATGAPDGADKRMSDRLAKHGWAGTVAQLPDVSKGEAEKAAAPAVLQGADLIFFTGGDQSRITERFRAAPELGRALNHAIHKEGTLIAGTSAGAAMMCDPMFTGGASESALAGAPADDGEPDDAPAPADRADGARPARRGVQMGPGLGLVAPITDTHFFERGRVGRLVAGLEKSGRPYGIGIGENRAVAVSGGAVCTALGGDCAALLVDVRELQRRGLSRIGTRVSLMSSGDTWTFPGDGERNRGVQTARPLTGGPVGINAPSSTTAKFPNAWGKNVALDMLRRLAADPRQAQFARSDRFELIISADERTRFGWSADRPGALTVIDARLDIVERPATSQPDPATTRGGSQ